MGKSNQAYMDANVKFDEEYFHWMTTQEEEFYWSTLTVDELKSLLPSQYEYAIRKRIKELEDGNRSNQ
jgi:hypothetical protein